MTPRDKTLEPPFHEPRDSGIKYWLIAGAIAALCLIAFGCGMLQNFDVISWEIVRE